MSSRELGAAVDAARGSWRAFVSGPRTLGGLVAVHARNKFLVLAHSEAHYRRLGRLVGTAGARGLDVVIAEYEAGFDEALRHPPTRGTHVNVLQHLAGMCRRGLEPAQRRALAGAIEAFGRGQAPLDEPRRLLRRHAEALGHAYVRDQSYLA